VADDTTAGSVPEVEPVRRKWRGVEPGARTADRRQRCIDAAIALLSTAGIGGTTVRAVCAQGGLHNRYFYESFDDMDALLVAVFDQLAAIFLADITAAADGAGDDPRARLQAVMKAVAQVVERETYLVRILTVEATGNEELNRRRIRMLHHFAELIEEDAYRTYGRPPSGERITAVSARFLAGGLAELFVAWVDGAMEGTLEELSQDAIDVVMAFSEASRAVAAARAARAARAVASPRRPRPRPRPRPD
jgi:AcrR family transcriptional regulator